MSETKSPLARLVLFMICLSIAGAFVAGVHYLAIDLPQQKSVTPPSNYGCVTIDQDTARVLIELEGYYCIPYMDLQFCCPTK